MKADRVSVDFSKLHLKSLHDIYTSIVYSAGGSDVDAVIVDGKIPVQNNRMNTLDEHAAVEKAEKTELNLASS